jgi:uncharacterized protein
VRIGVVSDTHGLLRPEVVEAFEGVEHILHAGDVGSLDVLVRLEALAPVTAVVGNTDGPALRERLPETARLELGGVRIVVLHGHRIPAATAAAAAAAHPDAGLVVFGHSHHAEARRIGGVLAVNPGSAGPRRFGDPVTAAIVQLRDGSASAELVRLLD